MRRAQVVKTGPVIEPADLDLVGRAEPIQRSSGEESALKAEEAGSERAELEALLRRHRGRVTRVAEELQMSRQALYRKMERLGIVLERKPRDD